MELNDLKAKAYDLIQSSQPKQAQILALQDEVAEDLKELTDLNNQIATWGEVAPEQSQTT